MAEPEATLDRPRELEALPMAPPSSLAAARGDEAVIEDLLL